MLNMAFLMSGFGIESAPVAILKRASMSKSSSFILQQIFGQVAEVKFVLLGSASQVFIWGHQLRRASPAVLVAKQISTAEIATRRIVPYKRAWPLRNLLPAHFTGQLMP